MKVRYKSVTYLVGFEGYRVGNDGSFWSSRNKSVWKRISGDTNKDGHIRVRVKNKRFYLHRLVLLAFKKQPLSKPLVLHNNGIPNDNRLCNLRFGTQKENSQDAVKHGCFKHIKRLKGERNPNSKLTEKQVLEIRKLAKTQTTTSLAKKYKIARSRIYDVVMRKTWKHI